MGMSGGSGKGGAPNIPDFGSDYFQPQYPIGPVGGRTGTGGKANTGQFGGFGSIRRMPPPRPSLQQQYAGLNQGVQGFQPLGIRGYTPPPQFQPFPIYGGGRGGKSGGGFGGGGGFNPFGYNSFQGNPFLNQPQLPTIPFNPPPINEPLPAPKFPEIEFDAFDYLDTYNRDFQDFDRESIPLPQFTKQVVEGGADRFVPQIPLQVQEPIPNIEAFQQMATPQISLQTNPVGMNQPLAEPVVPLAIDQGLQDRAAETQLALETATGPRTEGEFQAAKNAATAANLQKTFAESGGKTFEQEQAEAANAAAQAQSLANRPSPVTNTFSNIGMNPQQMSIPNMNLNVGKAAGGRVQGFAEGGMPEENQTGERLEEETIMALMGKHPNPKQVFNKYLEVYGEEGLMALAAEVEQMMSSQGRMIDGAGGGVDDFVPAMIDGVQPAALSKDEYVIPADVVAHAGDGSSEAGGKQFDQLVSRVRQSKTGNTTQPEQIEFEEEIKRVT